ncbi:DUF5928 domain-containing protein [Cognatiyoonia sp.]|uniref:DUF5928 domain-containing protein n=1 Tax=Cognatiyoonia sp. TaxID=2211652 RepID=UPI003F6A462D
MHLVIEFFCPEYLIVLTAAIRTHTDITAVNYLFSEEDTELPDLGGFENSLVKRTQHRRSLMRLLFECRESQKLVICLDTSSIDLLNDFFADRSRTRMLEIDCVYTDEYLSGHAKRVGPVAADAPDDVTAQLVPTIRYDIAHESRRIQDSNFEGYHRIQQTHSAAKNAEALASFLDLPKDVAQKRAETP